MLFYASLVPLVMAVDECILTDPELNDLRGPIGMTFDSEDYLYRDYNSAAVCSDKFVNDPFKLKAVQQIETEALLRCMISIPMLTRILHWRKQK